MAPGVADQRVAIALSYYSPYVSGLTNTARDIAEGLAGRGWDVTVVTCRHDRRLARTEDLNGVRVIRTPVVASLGKGLISPAFAVTCAREIRRAGLGTLHLPMLEAGAVAGLVGHRTPLVAMYHCDVILEATPMGRATMAALDASARMALRRSDQVVVSSLDYFSSSRLGTSSPARLIAIPPPSHRRAGGRPTFRDGDGPHIGFLGRIVAEKGVPSLATAFRDVAGPEWRLLLGGDHVRVAGGSTVDAVRRAARDDARIRILGFVPDERLDDFYASLDLFVLPSVNPLEAFGIAQAEAILAGVPVVASDLPGVRQPILTTGFGLLVPPGDVSALGDALQAAVRTPRSTWVSERHAAAGRFERASVLDSWEEALRQARSSGVRQARHGQRRRRNQATACRG